jgi:hypothetical protein
MTTSDTRSPYSGLPPRAFWRTGVAGQRADAVADLYRKKFTLDRSTKIATAGSCFAQHIARHLRTRGFSLIDEERPPPELTQEEASLFGYGIYSARYGNIYTARHLRQLAEEAFGLFQPADAVWQKDGRYFDAMRPSVEPTGLSSPDAVREDRRRHLVHVQDVIRNAGVFILTLGLTETWMHAASGTVYPTAPGTICGEYDPAIHQFRNFAAQEVYSDLRAFLAFAREQNPAMRLILTVSPVPLTATAGGDHVLSASTYSKAALRAAAGQLAQEDPGVDYFPSYEIVTSSLSAGRFFEENLRSVREEGVAAAMNAFFLQHDAGDVQITPEAPAIPSELRRTREDEICEDILLEAFAP